MGIQSSGMNSIHQMMQDFRAGNTNLSKEDLAAIQEDMKAHGMEVPEDHSTLIDSFDEIDQNGDGISLDEMQSYGQSIGMTFGLGEPPPGLMSNDGPPPGKPPGGPPPSMQGSTQEEEEEEESYLDKLLKQYSSYGSSSESFSTLSYSI